MKIVADLDLCQGHGMCADTAPDVFRVVDSEDGSYPHVQILVESLDSGMEDLVAEAIASCPNRALSIQS
jgi:ferredoxin